MTDFLLELRSEEIPARMQAKAREDLARLFAAELATAGLAADGVITYATPRRLALIARGLPAETQATAEELKGPRTSAPPQALDGFLRKTGLTREQLVERDGIFYAVIDRPGRATAEVLAQAIPAIVRAFPWPKSMRWGSASASTESLRWVRPLQGVVALLGGAVVPFEIAGIASGDTTVGHRFHAPGAIAIAGAESYAGQLRDAHVIVDQDERRQIIALGATMAAQKAGLTLVRDEGLLDENAGLTEWPMPLLGRFDAAFLEVPPEVIQLTARVNQKYFVCHDAQGKLANAFICTANIDATDGGAAIVEGNRKVLAARLSDARFFYDTDLKVALEEQAKKLGKIVFHEKLGTVADKVDRVAKLARWLVEEGIILPGTGRGTSEAGGGGAPQKTPLAEAPLHPQPVAGGPPPRTGEDLATLAERAARLAKADLVTGMVGEFPELQGLMGGYYARAQGEPREVWEAVRDHYKPVGQGDDVPTAPVTVAVSLADKLDTFVSYFRLSEFPTGSRDPFALRRSVLAIVAVLARNDIRLPLQDAINKIVSLHRPRAYKTAVRENKLLLSLFDPDKIEHLTVDRPGWDPSPDTFIIVNKTHRFGPFKGDPFDDLWSKLAIWHAAGELDARIFQFAADRLKVQQREAGVRHDLIDAVFALGGEDDLVRLLARVHALQAFITTDDGVNLLAGYKRAANILKKEGVAPLPAGEGGARSAEPSGRVRATESAPERSHPSGPAGLPPSPAGKGNFLSYTPEVAETALIAALDSAGPRAAAAVAVEDFAGAMAALATLRASIDSFFDTVIVNDPDPDKRAARLGLLSRIRAAVHAVADFSKIEG